MKTKWTIEHLQKLKDEGKILGWHTYTKSVTDLDLTRKKSRAKYRNEKVEWDGMIFDSKKEYRRYRELLLLLKAGKIGFLQRQVSFRFEIDGKSVGKYIADHVYIDVETGKKYVEDVKSEATRKLPTYRLKKKLMKAIYDIEIKEV